MNDQYYHSQTRETRSARQHNQSNARSRSQRHQTNRSTSIGIGPLPMANGRHTSSDIAPLRERNNPDFFRAATRDQLKKIGQSMAILVAITLLIFMSVASWNGSTMTGDLGLAIFTMTLVSALLFGFAYLTASYIGNKSFVFLVLILLAIALIKVGLVLTYQIGPTSDYWNYHYLAYARASGIPWTKSLVGVNSSWPHVLNIAFLYSIPYSLIGTNFITSQILNIAITFFDALLIYKLSASLINRQAGIFSALIFSVIPSYFLYSILNGAEPMFLTFVLGLLNSFDTFLRRDDATSNKRWFTNVLTMLVLAILAYMVRPTIAIWLVAGLLYIIFRRDTVAISTTLRLKRYYFYLGFFVLFFLFSSFSANIYSALYGMQIGSNDNMNRYSLATGTSPESQGTFDQKIYKIMDDNYKKYPDPNEMNKHIEKQLNDQIHSNVSDLNHKGNWRIFLDQKYTRFSAEDYGYDWLLYNTYKNNVHAESFFEMKKPLIALSVIFFEFLLISSIITLSWILLFAPIIPNSKDILNKMFYFSLLLDGFIIGSMIFEVQGRYHAVLYIPLVMILGLGIKIATERQNKINLTLSL